MSISLKAIRQVNNISQHLYKYVNGFLTLFLLGAPNLVPHTSRQLKIGNQISHVAQLGSYSFLVNYVS